VKREATLLIVDDEAEVREVLVEYFAAQGYAALGAGNAAAGGRRPVAGAAPARALLGHRHRDADLGEPTCA